MAWFRKPAGPPPQPPEKDPEPDVDQGWKTLSLINDWIKHAETKGAGSLAAAGVIGTLLFNLMKDRTHVNVWISIMATACAVFVVLAGLLAGATLRPRLRSKEDPTSPIYFGHIARSKADQQTYYETFRLLTADKNQIIKELAFQIWANANVAHTKYRWAGLAVLAVLLAVLCLGATAALIEAQARGWIHGK